MPHSVASDLGLHWLSMSHKKDARLICFNECNRGKSLILSWGAVCYLQDLLFACYWWRLLSAIDNLCKQSGPRSGPTLGQS